MVFIKLTQEQFDNLPSRNPNAYYVIYGKNLLYKGTAINPMNQVLSPYVPWDYPIIVGTNLLMTQGYSINKIGTNLGVE